MHRLWSSEEESSGFSTLYHLAQSGIRDAILLWESSQLTSGTTWHSAAQVRALRSSKNLTELIRYSFSFFDELEKETGQATGWMQTGSLSIATNQERWTHILRQQSLAKLFWSKSPIHLRRRSQGTLAVDE
ncbi:MAG: hypothetical protein Ct9H90mP9_0780 [Pseudomonadota bacterium]|nr:MAG: hypothetical protein Ct9H90mP9_0780 [Pseudomonadota bacterium]